MKTFDQVPMRELKSTSDFEQWLTEVNLFAQETLNELHDVAGLLKIALPRDQQGNLKTTNNFATSRGPSSPFERHYESSDQLNSDSDDPFASLQNKLAKQLKTAPSSNTNPSF